MTRDDIRRLMIQPITWNGIQFLPIKLRGNWNAGFTLAKHTTGSEYIGVDAWGRDKFDTIRTVIGEMVYQLKYGSDQLHVDQLHVDQLAGLCTEAVKKLILDKNTLDCVVPIPPSNDNREKQPVQLVAKKIAELLKLPYEENLIEKTTHTDQMKNVAVAERSSKLKDVFTVSKQDFTYNNILVNSNLLDTQILKYFETLKILQAQAVSLLLPIHLNYHAIIYL